MNSIQQRRYHSVRAIPTVQAIFTISVALTLSLGTSVQADTDAPALSINSEKRSVVVTEMISGLNHPWSLAFISPTDWLVTERSGQLRRVRDGQLLDAAITGLPKIDSVGQGGLLDVALHPDFATNNWVYLSYAGSTGSKHGTEVLRGQLIDNHLQNTEVIFKASPKTRGGRHFGSRLAFDDNGYLFISLGDRGSKKTAQQVGNHLGSIIRLHDDGQIPQDNPFADNPKFKPEIYSYGHRNVQGMVFDQRTKTLWAHEHGPQGGDELNRIQAGKNYGWPIITYGVNYVLGTKIGEGTSKPGMEQPVTYWDPSIAPSGLAIVDSPRFPEWQGNLLVGALKYKLITRLELDDNSVTHEERLLAGELGRIRDVRQAPDGYIYVLTDSDKGSIYKIE